MTTRIKYLLICLMMIMTSVFSIVPLATPVSAAATGGECDDNAVVRCGIYSTADLKARYTGDVKAAYNYFGITDGMINGTTATIKNGTVNRNGDVILDGKVVATGAITAGRQNISGSTKFTAGGSTFYQRPSTVSFVSRSVFEAYIMVDSNGQFMGAVLKPCGNPVKAKPVVVKNPAAACTAVTVDKISRTEYRFTATATVKDGATISGYSFKVSNASSNEVKSLTSTATSATSPVFTVKNAGEYTVVATVKTSLGDKTGADCTAKFTVEKEPEVPVTPPKNVEVCNPETGQTITVDEKDASKYKPVGDVACEPKVESAKDEKVEVIASTGPAEVIGGVAGLGSLTAAGYYLRASRQRLLSAFKK
jgi:hypothetical protein